jgi:hypothetical protein
VAGDVEDGRLAIWGSPAGFGFILFSMISLLMDDGRVDDRSGKPCPSTKRPPRGMQHSGLECSASRFTEQAGKRLALKGAAMRRIWVIVVGVTLAACNHDGLHQGGGPGWRPGNNDDGGKPGNALDAGSLLPDATVACVNGGGQFTTTGAQPNLMLVLDRSGSMKRPLSPQSMTIKWDDLKSAVGSLLQQYDSQVQFGASTFSSDGQCAPGKIDVALAPTSGQAILDKLDSLTPAGYTPTAKTLANVNANGGLKDPARANYVVLATDGEPNCGDNSADVIAQITQLFNSTPQVKTFVIGIGTSATLNAKQLNAWAKAGGTQNSGATQYYQTNSLGDLTNALDAIVNHVGCDFTTGQPASPGAAISVTLNGAAVAPGDPNGFTYNSSTGTTTLQGTACKEVQSIVSQVDISYTCPQSAQ